MVRYMDRYGPDKSRWLKCGIAGSAACIVLYVDRSIYIYIPSRFVSFLRLACCLCIHLPEQW